MTVAPALDNLGREFPEWKPWLPVVEEVLTEAATSKWEAFVPPKPLAQQKTPLLAGATVSLDLSFVNGWLRHLIKTAHRSGTPKMTTLAAAETANLEIASLFSASLRQESERLKEIGLRLGVDSDAFRAVADLVPIPFLQACGRQWTVSRSGWLEGYCPLCGAWPTFAEIRGIERSRHLRCGRCGGDWESHWLCCPFCGTTAHEQLASLVPDAKGTTRTVDVCKQCLGYVKSFNTLQGTPAAKVMIDDLASVDLDIAALEQGFRRPAGAGYALELSIAEQPSLRKIFPWSR
jgi:FdhE protein